MTDRQQRPPTRPIPRGTRGRGDSHGGTPDSLHRNVGRLSQDTVAGSFDVPVMPRVSEQTASSAQEVLADSSLGSRPLPQKIESAYEVIADGPPRVRPVAAGDRQEEGSSRSRSSRGGFSRDSADTVVVRVEAPTKPTPQQPPRQTAGAPRQEGKAGSSRVSSISGTLRRKSSAIQLRVKGTDPDPRPAGLSHNLAGPAATVGSQLTVASEHGGGFSRQHSVDTVLEAPPGAPEDLAALLRLPASPGPARERSFFAGLSATGSFAQQRESRQTVATSLSDRGVFTTGLAGFLSTAKAGSQTPSLVGSSVGTAPLHPPTWSVSRDDIDQGSPSRRGASPAGVRQDEASRGSVGRGDAGQGSPSRRGTSLAAVRQDAASRGSVGRVDIDQGSPSRRGSSLAGVRQDAASRGSVGRVDIQHGSPSRRGTSLTGVGEDEASRTGVESLIPVGVGQGEEDHASRGDVAQGSPSRRSTSLGNEGQSRASHEAGVSRRSTPSAMSRRSLTKEAAIPSDADRAVASSVIAVSGHETTSGVSGDVGLASNGRTGRTAVRGATPSSDRPQQHPQERAVHRGPSGATALVTRSGDVKVQIQSGTKIKSTLETDPYLKMSRMGMGDFHTSTTPAVDCKGTPPTTGDKWAGSSAVLWRAPAAPRSASRSASPQGRAGDTANHQDQEAPHVDRVGVWEGKAFVVQPPPPSEPTTTPGRAELRRPRSAVFSIKRPPLAVPASSTDPAAEALIHHIDNVLPKGLRNLLLQLENHSDLGVMALYAVTLNRHRRLSSALRQLQQLQARTRSPEKPPKVSQPARSRWGRWRRGLLFPMALRPASPPPPPPLPPTHRPDLFSVERCLHDALERGLSGLGPEDDSCDSSRTQAEYNDAWTADACRILAAFITRATAKLDLKRYKTACVVRIIEKRQQRFCSHFAALWNSDCDGYCSVIHETDTLVAHALLMLVYWD